MRLITEKRELTKLAETSVILTALDAVMETVVDYSGHRSWIQTGHEGKLEFDEQMLPALVLSEGGSFRKLSRSVEQEIVIDPEPKENLIYLVGRELPGER